MANYTEHYHLHQWEPEDPFLRTDFNEDLNKIDQAILAAKDASGCVTANFVGNGGKIDFDLGFRPKFMVITAPHTDSSHASDLSLVLGTEAYMIGFDSYGFSPYAKITCRDTGFSINDPSADGINGLGQNNCYTVFY